MFGRGAIKDRAKDGVEIPLDVFRQLWGQILDLCIQKGQRNGFRLECGVCGSENLEDREVALKGRQVSERIEHELNWLASAHMSYSWRLVSVRLHLGFG